MRQPTVILVAVSLLAAAAVLALAGVGEADGALTDWQALVLGVVQGATELLPVSSSGHLVLVPWLGGWTFLEQNDEFNHTFDVALHLGTMLAVLVYFWHEAIGLLVAWVATLRERRIRTTEQKTAWLVLLATIPAALAGYFGEGVLTTHLGEPWQIAILLAGFALLLWWADRTAERRQVGDLGYRQALLVGAAQALALMPGVSRSGITITAGRFLGLTRDAAARFSFLLLLPTVLGAVVYKGVTDVLLGELPDGWRGPFLVGTLAAFGSGLLAILGLLDYVRRHDYSLFVVYRLVAAAIVVLLIVSGARAATF